MERKIEKRKFKSFWSRLFEESSIANFEDLTDEEFDNLVKLLSRVNTSIDWEADKSSKKILFWKPRVPTLLLREYRAFIFLLACLKGAGKGWLKNVS